MAEQDHDEKDGCLCGCDLNEREHTADHDLPAAVGGVEGDTKVKRRKATRTAVEGE